MPLINCKISLYLVSITFYYFFCNWKNKIWYKITTDTTADTKLYDPVVTLSTKDNKKLLKQLECGFKGTINWNKYQGEREKNKYFDYVIDPSFLGVNRFFCSIVWK